MTEIHTLQNSDATWEEYACHYDSKETDQQPTVSSSLLLKFCQIMKHVGILIAAVTIGLLIGAGVGVGVYAIATPGAAMISATTTAVGTTGYMAQAFYSLFSSSNRNEQKDRETNTDYPRKSI